MAKSLIDDKVEEDAEARRRIEISASSRSPRTKTPKALGMIAANGTDVSVLYLLIIYSCLNIKIY